MRTRDTVNARCRQGLLGVLVVGATLAACSSDDGSVDPLEDPDETGRELVGEFNALLQSGDSEQLDEFLSNSFQLMLSDGSSATKGEFVASLQEVSDVTIGDEVFGTQEGDVLVVRWSVDVESEGADGPLAAGLAPRLSTFHYEDGEWRMSSHANFGELE
ncbi:MAG: nuclear transport factor 2 family protein [Actinomycetota bacterium]